MFKKIKHIIYSIKNFDKVVDKYKELSSEHDKLRTERDYMKRDRDRLMNIIQNQEGEIFCRKQKMDQLSNVFHGTRRHGNSDYLLRAALNNPGVVIVCIDENHKREMLKRWRELLKERKAADRFIDPPRFLTLYSRTISGAENLPFVIDLAILSILAK